MNSTRFASQRFRHEALRLAVAVLLFAVPEALSAQIFDDSLRSLRGTVVNSVSLEPIGHALVFSPDNRFATMTDDQGQFEFALPRQDSPPQAPPTPDTNRSPAEQAEIFSRQLLRQQSLRPSQLGARKPGFLEEGANQPIGQDQKEVTIPLIPEALIVGRIILPDDADRIPVQLLHRQISAGRASWVVAGTAIAKSNGEFRFSGLRPGKYKLLTQEVIDRDPLTLDPRGQLYGFPPVYFPSAPDFASAATIDLAAGNTFQATLSPARQPYYQVSVPVSNAFNPNNVQVLVFPQGRRGAGYSLGYNQQEQRIEGLLPDGNYTVEASNGLFGPAAASGAVNLTVRGALQGPPLTLVPAGSVAVNVKEEFTSAEYSPARSKNFNGRNFVVKGPSSYLNVILMPADSFGLEYSTALDPPFTGVDESLTIHVLPGKYWVEVSTSRGFAASISSGGVDLQHQPLLVGTGGTVPAIEITMRDDWAQISGKIQNTDNSLHSASSISGDDSRASVLSSSMALPDAWFCLIPLPDSPGQIQQMAIAPQGETGDLRVPPGAYRALAFDHEPPDLEFRDPDALRAYDGKGKEVHLIAGQKERVTLPLIKVGESQ